MTLYVPPTKRLVDVVGRLRSEQVQAENIKDRVTRQSIVSALGRLIHLLNHMPSESRSHGWACFIGGDEEQIIEPPEPITTYLYRCGSGFALDPLLQMTMESEVYGLIVIDRQEASIGWLKGTRVVPVETYDSHLMGKHRAGGQSQHRFERTMENEEVAYYRRVAEHVLRIFDPCSHTLSGIFVGGPGSTKDYFLEQSDMDYRLKAMVLQPTANVGYTDESGLWELARTVSSQRSEMALTKERNVVTEFLTAAKIGTAIYGAEEIRALITEGRAKKLWVSSGRPDVLEWVTQAEAARTEVIIVSDGSPEGHMFLSGFQGLGALPRW